jgi:hypothetical protein
MLALKLMIAIFNEKMMQLWFIWSELQRIRCQISKPGMKSLNECIFYQNLLLHLKEDKESINLITGGKTNESYCI